jgi:hypothetical protein
MCSYYVFIGANIGFNNLRFLNQCTFGIIRKCLDFVSRAPIDSLQFTKNTSISTRKIMGYSMFISGVNNITSFVMWTVMTSFGKNNI